MVLHSAVRNLRPEGTAGANAQLWLHADGAARHNVRDGGLTNTSTHDYLRTLLQRALVVSYKLLNTLDCEFMRNVKALPWEAHIQFLVRD